MNDKKNGNAKLTLSTLGPRPGARKVRRRVGRGESSGAGKTSGKGGKGQTARTGGTVKAGFEGGQMPLYRRLPKIGFVSHKRVVGKNVFVLVKLSELEKFENGAVVDRAALVAGGLTMPERKRGGIKVLSAGKLTKKLTVKVEAISASAKAAIESAGGTVELV